MRILQINATYKIGSTGKIMSDLSDVIVKNGHESYILCGYANALVDNLFVLKQWFSYPRSVQCNIMRMRLTGRNGYSHKKETKKAVEWIDSIKPDIIHLHNIHGDWIHLETLFDYIKINNIPVVWTLHDCWSFTGRCANFELFGCEKWKSNCYDCKNKKVYPITYLFDFSKKMHQDKKDMFLGVKNIHFVTPSLWLAEYVKQSMFKQYPVSVINNGIDTNIFHRVETRSKYISDWSKKVILGVASSWSKRKGFDDFIKLNELINHKEYQIVMVGLNSKQLRAIPDTIIGIGRTNNQQELVELYSGAYVFVNPTYEDNYPTVNLEAQACGCPVITYRTGGSPESVCDYQVIDKGNIDDLLKCIAGNCLVSESDLSKFDKRILFQKYISIYKNMKME